MKTVISVDPRDLWEIFQEFYKIGPGGWEFKGGSGSVTMTLVKSPKTEFYSDQDISSFREAVKKSQEAYKKSLETDQGSQDLAERKLQEHLEINGATPGKVPSRKKAKPEHKPAWKIDQEREQEERARRDKTNMENILAVLREKGSCKMKDLLKAIDLQDQQIRRLIYRMPQEVEIVGSMSARRYQLKKPGQDPDEQEIPVDWNETEKLTNKEREEQEEASKIEEAEQ